MSRFIRFNYTSDLLTSTVLVNVEMIQTVDLIENQVYVKVAGVKFAYPVDRTFEEVMALIHKSNGTITAHTKAQKGYKPDPAIVQLFEDLLNIYGRHVDITHALRARFEDYEKLRVHSLTERLKRLQTNHEKWELVASRNRLVKDLRTLLNEIVEH